MDNWELIAEATLQEDSRTFRCETVPLKKIWVFCQTSSPAEETTDYKSAQWGALKASGTDVNDFKANVVRRSNWPRPVMYYADVTSGIRRQAFTLFDGEGWTNTKPYDLFNAYQTPDITNASKKFFFPNWSNSPDAMTGFQIQMANSGASDLIAAGSKMKIYGVRA